MAGAEEADPVVRSMNRCTIAGVVYVVPPMRKDSRRMPPRTPLSTHRQAVLVAGVLPVRLPIQAQASGRVRAWRCLASSS